MTPANPDALADALARELARLDGWQDPDALWTDNIGIIARGGEGSPAYLDYVEDAGKLIAGPLAPILAAKEAAEARAAQLQAEVEALKEDRADAERTLEQWFDTKAKSVEQIGPKLAEALGGYLRVCRCGGMSAEESELVEATLGDFLHRQAGSIIAPVVEAMVADRTALAARAATAREGQTHTPASGALKIEEADRS